MITVTLQRQKCIGCNYCQELCPDLFRMSKKDGKAVLLKATDKKGFASVRANELLFEAAVQSSKACPIHIISVREV